MKNRILKEIEYATTIKCEEPIGFISITITKDKNNKRISTVTAILDNLEISDYDKENIKGLMHDIGKIMSN